MVTCLGSSEVYGVPATESQRGSSGRRAFDATRFSRRTDQAKASDDYPDG